MIQDESQQKGEHKVSRGLRLKTGPHFMTPKSEQVRVGSMESPGIHPKWRRVEGSPHLPYEFTGRDDFGFETLPWKVFGIEGDYNICVAGFSADAKRVVLGIGRNLNRGMRRAVESVERLVFGPKWTQVQAPAQPVSTRLN